MNFSTSPAWLFKTDKPVTYPADPNQVFGTTPGNRTARSHRQGVGRLLRAAGELVCQRRIHRRERRRHESGYHYKFPVWEVLNEVDYEHKMTPEQYTTLRCDRERDSCRVAGDKVHGHGAGLSQPTPGVLRVLPESSEPQARHSARHDLVSLLCLAMAGQNLRLAVHILRSGSRISEHGAVYRGDPQAPFASDEDRSG
jgi:hypothetical protein